MTFAELKELLFARSNFGMKLGLERMRAALALLGEPQRSAPVLHVAGTNGKGSTCAFTEASLRAAGFKTGLYTSPHLVHFCERIQIDGAPVSEERAAALLEEILARVPWALSGTPGGEPGDGLTFFELVTLMAFLAFARAGVDAMVIEVGLGGRLDATNVVEPLACAIAPLALEHTQYLGDTLEAIAAEKGGILKAGAPAAIAEQPAGALRVLEEIGLRVGAPLCLAGRGYQYARGDSEMFGMQMIGTPHDRAWSVALAPVASTQAAGELARDPRSGLALRGAHQRQNAALAGALRARATERGRGSRSGRAVRPEHLALGLQQARWPGRLQLFSREPLLFLDGAHNPHGAQALARTLHEEFPERRFQIVFGALADKDLAQLLGPLLPMCAGLHACAPSNPRALAPSAVPARVAGLAPALSCQAYGSPAEALAGARSAAAREGSRGAVLGCGSLYLVGELLSLLEEREHAAMPSEVLHAARAEQPSPVPAAGEKA